MPRTARKPSGTGIYHVMMRGVNRQDIFRDNEDYCRFVTTLDRVQYQYDEEGNPCGQNCTYYAYCLMKNHFHLLIRERDEQIGATIKRIASSYVYYYNRKYERDGHLFRERFRSEPVNDMAYFTQLLRYIHQNPVKAGSCEHVDDYEFSSWGEYNGRVEPYFHICDTSTILKRIPFIDLQQWVETPLPDDVECLDLNDDLPQRLSDDQVWKYIRKKTGAATAPDFQQLDDATKRDTLRSLKHQGASHRQLERLTGIGRGLIQKL